MKIADLFYSIQGEGSLVGVPSAFVRLSGCNLRCHWCDTPYTSWKPTGEEMSLARIVEEVRAFETNHVVVTGGEPMLFQEVVALTREFRAMGMHITIETAGTVFRGLECDLMSISPKLANSVPEGPWATQHDRLRIQPGVLSKLMTNYDHQLKFVVERPEDIEEIRQLLRTVAAEPGRVILMPEGTDRQVLRERSVWLADICKLEGFRFSPRLHVELWGSRRGV